jgi:uncharacterized protein (DUF4415 family)
MSRDAADAKAREALEAVTEHEVKAVSAPARANPDALPLDEEHLARMRAASAAAAADIKRRLRGRPNAQAPKHLVSLRLDPDVIKRFRATWPGWQSRINDVLRRHLPQLAG